MNRNITIPVLALLAATAFAAGAEARTWKVQPDIHSLTEASFTSRAAIVKFTGRTSHVEGWGEIDANQPSLNPKGEVSVDLTTLDTGIGMRNDHMKGMIEAAKYPTATFKLQSLKAPRLVANAPVNGLVAGLLTIHGVSHVITAPVSLTLLPEEDKQYRPGDWVATSTEFKIKLSDYGIQLPKPVLGVKVSDELTLSLDGMARAVEP